MASELGPFEYRPQTGTPGNCFVAQVFGPDGNSVARIDSTNDEADATAIARLFAASDELLASLELIVDAERLTADGFKRARQAIAKAKGECK